MVRVDVPAGQDLRGHFHDRAGIGPKRRFQRDRRNSNHGGGWPGGFDGLDPQAEARGDDSEENGQRHDGGAPPARGDPISARQHRFAKTCYAVIARMRMEPRTA
jgi:hypothetical protein